MKTLHVTKNMLFWLAHVKSGRMVVHKKATGYLHITIGTEIGKNIGPGMIDRMVWAGLLEWRGDTLYAAENTDL